MKLKSVRKWFTEESTISEVTLDGVHECFFLEDKYRGDDPAAKVPGKTAIPCGTYVVRKTWSPRFKRMMYAVEDVPGFKGIRIHAGNRAEHTEGCLLTGRTRGQGVVNFVGESVKALQALESKLDAAELRGEAITLEIVVERAT